MKFSQTCPTFITAKKKRQGRTSHPTILKHRKKTIIHFDLTKGAFSRVHESEYCFAEGNYKIFKGKHIILLTTLLSEPFSWWHHSVH